MVLGKGSDSGNENLGNSRGGYPGLADHTKAWPAALRIELALVLTVAADKLLFAAAGCSRRCFGSVLGHGVGFTGPVSSTKAVLARCLVRHSADYLGGA